MKSKLFILMFMTILLVSSVSAWTTKSYDIQTNTITIDQSSWYDPFGWITEKTILESTLNTPQIYQVGIGENIKVAQFTINPNKDYSNVLGSFEFYDLNDNNKKVDRQVDVKYLGLENYSVDDYTCNKVISKNGTMGQDCYLSGSHIEQREAWIDWDKNVYANKEVVVGLFTNVGMDETIEWIPTIAGLKIQEWAVFTSGATTTSYLEDGNNYTVVTYLNNGTFNSTKDILNVSILVIAGGGGGSGGQYIGAGGGAGGLIYNNSFDILTGNYNIVIGTGGNGGVVTTAGINGADSFISFSNNTKVKEATGGGRAGVYGGADGGNGGSGGGATDTANDLGGTGIAGQGNNGGNFAPAGAGASAGGGGAGSVGLSNVGTTGGNGGAGLTYSINGTSTCYAGGGGGASNSGVQGVGTCGGGSGTTSNGGNGINGTGGGGGGAERTGGMTGGRGGNGIIIIRYLTYDALDLTIILLSPTNNTNFTTSTNYFVGNVINLSANPKIQNVSLLINGTINQTNTSGISGIYNFSQTLADGFYNWTVIAFGNDSIGYNASNGTLFFTIDTIYPIINITYPTNTTYIFGLITVDSIIRWFNWTAIDTNRDKCWWSNNSGVNNYTITCNANSSFNAFYGTTNFIAWVNDTSGNLGVGRITATWIAFLLQNSINYSSTIYETETTSYWINVTANSSLTSAKLYLNGTSYTGVQSGSIWNYTFGSMPSSKIGNNSIIWGLTYAGVEYNTTTQYQTINPIQFGLCNGTLTIPYMNFTFKDEGSLNFIKASIPSSTFIYYLGDGSVNKTYLYTNTTANLDYKFCALPSSQTYYIKTNIQYKNDTNYPQRIFDEVVKTFTNVTTNKTLYLLSSAEGIYVTYQVLDAIGNQLSGVQVNVNRTIEGSPYNVGNGQTDSAGSITFWLNPDFIHSLSFTKSGYETFSLAQFPTQSAYTITLGTSTGLGINDYIRGITYTFLPNSGELLNASQLYNFNLTFNSTYWTLDSFGFILYGDGTVIGGNYSTSSSGGYLENVLNVSSYTHISIKIYWIINGTTTYGINDGNYVFVYEGTEWSIFNFFTDLKRYMIPTYHPETNSYTGIFGLNQNSLNLIIFVIIFLTTGLVSYKFSLTSPAIVTGMIFGLVFLFDVGLGLISVPVGAVQHFPTIFMLLITVALAIWEMRR